jgi:hypothetical protein
MTELRSRQAFCICIVAIIIALLQTWQFDELRWAAIIVAGIAQIYWYISAVLAHIHDLRSRRS